jgi:hypothetical protein
MPNATVLAAAPGLPAINRRFALFGAAATLAPSSARAAQRENPALATAGIRLAPALAAYHRARQRKLEARAAYERIAPAIPDEMLGNRDHVRWGFTEAERDCEGKVIFRRDNPRGNAIIRSANLEGAIAGFGENSVIADIARCLLPAALAFEAREQAARESVGLDTAIDAEFRTSRDVEHIALSIAEMPACTAAGVRIKAEALTACGEIGTQMLYRACVLIGPELASAALQILPAPAA